MRATIHALARYPVKSMLGETLDSCELRSAGIVGDRAYALVDCSDGRVASAKHPRKWGRLLECRARFVDEPQAGMLPPPVEIQLPGGDSVRSDEARADSTLSAIVGRDVTLRADAPQDRRFEEVWPDIEGIAPAKVIASTTVATEPTGERVSEFPLGLGAPPGAFFDLAVLHLLTTATLRTLASLDPAADFHWRRFRPNIVVEHAGAGFAENAWLGRLVLLGGAAARVSIPTMRCVMTTLAQDGRPRDPATLRAIAASNRLEIAGFGTWACAGVYASVEQPGLVRVGDEVQVRR